MEITAKGRYAVRIMVDIAKNSPGFVSLADISSRQNISVKYAEKIISMLVKGNLLESMRGQQGGYKLIKNPCEYSVKEILVLTGDVSHISRCDNESECERRDICDAVGVFVNLNDIINEYLKNVSLQDLIDKTYGRYVLKVEENV
ncbi:MAG: Rrf2 family transcriptional regulator [Clostridia bacterium]|nr:Rrf2 family transcriptional regulator [Clostridia bacterium]